MATHIPLEVFDFSVFHYWFCLEVFGLEQKRGFSLVVTIRSMLRQHMQDYSQGHTSFDMDFARFFYWVAVC